MLSLGVEFLISFILLIHIGNASGSVDDYWSDDFDSSRNCENKGRSEKRLIVSMGFNLTSLNLIIPSI